MFVILSNALSELKAQNPQIAKVEIDFIFNDADKISLIGPKFKILCLVQANAKLYCLFVHIHILAIQKFMKPDILLKIFAALPGIHLTHPSLFESCENNFNSKTYQC